MKYCPECGSPLPEPKRFCPECGAPLTTVAPSAPAAFAGQGEGPGAGMSSQVPNAFVGMGAYLQPTGSLAGMGALMDTPAIPVTSDDPNELLSFTFDYSDGMMFASGRRYSGLRTAEGGRLTIRMTGMRMEDAPRVEVDQATWQRIAAILSREKTAPWDGFNRRAEGVFDGASFSFSATYGADVQVNASGYMSWPEGWGEAKLQMNALMDALYRERFPSKAEALERFYQEELVPRLGEVRDHGFTYGYRSEGDGAYSYTPATLPEGLIAHRVGSFTAPEPFWMDAAKPGGAPTLDLLCVQVERRPLESRQDCTGTALRFGVWTMGEDMAVIEGPDGTFITNLFWADDVSARVFIHRWQDHNLIGFWVRSQNHSGLPPATYRLFLVDLAAEPPAVVADEKVQGPNPGESWTPDMAAPFVQVAEDFGFTRSVERWRRDPADLTPEMTDLDTVLTIRAVARQPEGFPEALAVTPAGTVVEGFRVEGGWQ